VKITTNERAVLEALADGDSHSVPDLLDLGRVPANRSPQGIHESAASLARKGYVEKTRDHQRVFLRITSSGHERLEKEHRD
jgi:DNA-binding MarR family transcriptional regulator